MNSDDQYDHENSPALPLEKRILRIFVSLFFIVLFLGGGLGIATYFMMNPAKSEKKGAAEKVIPFVSVVPAVLGDHPVMIELMGQVEAEKEAMIKAQVGGEIVSVSERFVPGGFFKAGEEILRIDDKDYALDVRVKGAAYNQAKAALDLELGQQEIAKQELELLRATTGKALKNSDLALRKPQLKQARADLESAQANLDMAKLMLERTIVRAPFDAVVVDRNSTIGNVVGTQDVLATLVNTKAYWVRTEVPAHHLSWIQSSSYSVPEGDESPVLSKGSSVSVSLNRSPSTRDGFVLNVNGKIDAQSRLADVIVQVDDPLLLGEGSKVDGALPLVIGDYVRLNVHGKTLEDVAKLPLTYLRRNQTIWILRDGLLAIVPVKLVYEDRYFAYVASGISEGDLIITSDIVTPVDGMALRVREEKTPSNPDVPPPSPETTQE